MTVPRTRDLSPTSARGTIERPRSEQLPPALTPGEALEIVQAIRSGEVDAFVHQNGTAAQIRLLEGADEPYRLLVDAMGEGAVVLDRSGLVLFANPAMGRLVGVGCDALLGHGFGKHLAAGGARALKAAMPTFIKVGGTLDVRLQRASAEVHLHLNGRPISSRGFQGAILVATDYSDLHRLSSEIAASETRLRSALETMLDGVLLCTPIHDKEGLVFDFTVDYSNGASRGVHTDPDLDQNIIGSRLSEVHPGIAKAILPPLISTLKTGVPTALEEVRVSLGPLGGAPGKERIYSLHAARCDPGLLLLIRDVTDAIHAKIRLQELASIAQRGSERMSAILEAAGEGIYVLDMEGRCTVINPAACAILGYDAGAVLGQDVHALSHHSRRDGSPYPRSSCPSWATLITGSSCVREQELYWRKDGTAVDVEYSSAPLEADGVITGAVVVFQDISDRNRSSQALRESEAYLQQAQELAGIGTWTAGTGPGAEISCSSITWQIVGTRPGGIKHLRDMIHLIHPDDVDSVASMLERGRITAAGTSIEHRIVRPDGGVRWVHLGARLTGAPGEAATIVGVIRDITDAKMVEERERTQAMLQGGLAKLAKEGLAATDVAQLGETACDIAATVMGGSYVSLVHVEADRMRLVADHGMPAETAREAALEASPIIARTVESGRPVAVRDYLDNLLKIHPPLATLGIRSSICVPVLGSGRSWGALCVHVIDPRTFAPDETKWLTALADVLSVVIDRIAGETELHRTVEELRRTDQQRRAVVAQLVDAQEDERRRIAGEIHDDAVQAMTAVNLRLHILGRELAEEAKPSLEKLQGEVSDSIARLRSLLFELAPPALDEYGLAAALRMNAEQHRGEGSILYRIVSSLRGEPSTKSRVVLYRIAQEALANARKHARAGTVEIHLRTTNHGTQVRVQDDGRGFVAETTPVSEPGHLGLSSMEERARVMGGWWRLKTAPGAGTTVEFWVPGIDPQATGDGIDAQTWESGAPEKTEDARQ